MPTIDARELESLLGECMIADRRRLRRQLRGPRRRRGERPRKPSASDLERVAERIEASRARAERRRRLAPTPTYPEELPVAARRDEIREAIAAHQVVVVCGETGSGKTTQLPKICLELGRGIHGAIGHTQPRRIAARTVSQRIASELNTRLGELVGSKVRFTDETGPDTLIKLMTDGILLAETQGDRDLERYDTIIIDEAHERSLNIDFLIGYLRDLLPRRPDLKVIITSATIDPERFSEHFGGAPIIEVSGRTYPVEVRYRPRDESAESELALDEAVVEGVRECLGMGGGGGDVLVFLPGEREIRDVARALEDQRFPRLEVLPLYARLSWQEQARVFAPHPGRRVVLATNVAETSLTVPNIRFVIDSGVARIGRYSARSRVQRLPVEAVSQASASQRAGRCGRVGPGVCLRLYSEEDFLAREEHTPPEIVRTNLASVVLQMKALRLGDVTRFPFMDPPDHRLVRDGYETLLELGAGDEDGELTEIGRSLARLPIDPRIGRMLLAAEKENALAETLVIAAALSIQDPRERPHERRTEADAAHEEFADERSDFLSLLNLWRFYREQQRKLSRGRLRKMCAQRFLSYVRMREWSETQHQLRRLLSEMGVRSHRTAEAEADAIHRSLLVGLLSNIGRLREDGEYEGAGGKRFAIHPGSAVFAKRPKWVMASELVRTTKLYARGVARIDPKWLEELAPHLLRRTHSDPWWDAKSGRVMCHERVTLFGLEVVPKRSRHFGPIDPEASRRIFIHHGLVEGEMTTRGRFMEHNRRLLERVRTLQDKGRRGDLLADTTARFAFFDRVVPADVYSAQRFEKWRRSAERSDPEALCLSESDVVTADVSDLGPERFPDEARIDAHRTASLAYRFDPTARDDGVTLVAPVDLVGLIDEREVDLVSPGVLERRVEALIRAAPKEIRRRFTPAGEWARRAVSELRPGAGTIEEKVAEALSRLCGAEVDPSIWAHARLPDHTLVNIRAVDEKGEVVAESRDLASLRRELGAAGRLRMRTIPHPELDADGLRGWPVDELPRKVVVRAPGGEVEGYPALLDEGKAAGVRVLADAASARRAMRAGVRRLATISLGDAVRSYVEGHPSHDAIALRASTIGDAGSIMQDLVELIVERSTVGDGKPPRRREEFEALLDRGWNRLADETERVMGLVEPITSFHQAVDLALEQARPASWQRAIDDIDEQLAWLFRGRFVLETPHRWLGQYPRYLKGIAQRIDRLRQGGAAAVEQDARWMAEVAPYWRAWKERREDHDVRGLADPALEEFRWMVEEYRVSLFAQMLGTAVKVSPQRLRKQWQQTRA